MIYGKLGKKLWIFNGAFYPIPEKIQSPILLPIVRADERITSRSLRRVDKAGPVVDDPGAGAGDRKSLSASSFASKGGIPRDDRRTLQTDLPVPTNRGRRRTLCTHPKTREP